MDTRYVQARARGIQCDECLRPIRWWNRRVSLDSGEGWAHLRCWNSLLFLKALVADEIRWAQLATGEIRPTEIPPDEVEHPQTVAEENPSSPILLSDAIEERVASDEPLQADAAQSVEGLQTQLNSEDTQDKIHADRNERSPDSSPYPLGQHLRRFLWGGSSFRNFGSDRRVPSSPPLPPRLCSRCGAFALRATSMFCTKCGGPLRSGAVSADVADGSQTA
jgi:hypothetical protein